MPRGGRRPGAGAPKGNFNALKTGKHSARAQRAIDAIVSSPEGRAALAKLALRAQPSDQPSPRRARDEMLLVARGLTPYELTERHKRLVRRMRRLRAMLTVRMEREDRCRNSWHAMLEEERASLQSQFAESVAENEQTAT